MESTESARAGHRLELPGAAGGWRGAARGPLPGALSSETWGPRGQSRAGSYAGGAGLRLGGSHGGTYLNLPWQCWHWSPTQPGSHRQVELTQRPEKQEPVLSQGLDWDT